MKAEFGLSEMIQLISMLTDIISLYYVVFSNKNNRRK